MSGGPVAALAKFFNVAPTDVVVVHDELDLDPADYVLRNFNAKEREELAFTLPTAAEAVEIIASHGLEIAQNQVHGR
ncbi:aminoacyl-tRNA hydrolase [Corynebacterium sp. MSK297]|uniref:aminoacyl-tRNA hydrolase n=1 Tax=Corynebacterium sp. MSK297 TaxID=3050221 RepID=UPI00254AA2A0|nr:aminoacyl-tRNA hydrolase [Corynebacterium sp. MSK297]MDK8846837.1 aminoacyl-tRNA hydrolase [Corynebacterium sp. MSK297]